VFTTKDTKDTKENRIKITDRKLNRQNLLFTTCAIRAKASARVRNKDDWIYFLFCFPSCPLCPSW
jgi:hypothetical protein